MLTQSELLRYSRQIILSEIGTEGQKKLKQAKALIAGAGGLGCPALQYLAGAGAGTLCVIDYDTVDESNLHRQILFSANDIGKSKAETAARKLSLLNPYCQSVAVNRQLVPANALELIRNYDVIIDGSDNFPTRYLLNDACVLLNKPLVSGSIYRFEGQLSVYNYKGGPTYRCLFPQPPRQVPDCSEAGVLGVLPGIIGTLMANEAIKIITGAGEVLSGKLLVFNALKNLFQVLNFSGTTSHASVKLLDDYGAFCAGRTPENGLERPVREISAEDLNRMLTTEQPVQIIDVREPNEYATFNIKGFNIPLGEIAGRTEEIRRDIPVVVHCARGGRSKRAIKLLQMRFGFTNLLNLTGGVEEFKKLKIKN